MINKLLQKWFNCRIEFIRMADQPREIVRAFAYEMDRELKVNVHLTDEALAKVGEADAMSAALKMLQTLTNDLSEEKTDPDKVRAHSCYLAIAAMTAADNWGHLRK